MAAATAVVVNVAGTAVGQKDEPKQSKPALTKAGFAKQRLNIQMQPEVKPADKATTPRFGYLSASVGGFTLDGMKGQASFIYNHDLDVDWHAHTLSYRSESSDSAGNKYWVYAIDDHKDEYLAFSQKQAAGFPDEGYRIFYIHVEGAEKHTHLVAWDAKRLPYHKHSGHDHDHDHGAKNK